MNATYVRCRPPVDGLYVLSEALTRVNIVPMDLKLLKLTCVQGTQSRS